MNLINSIGMSMILIIMSSLDYAQVSYHVNCFMNWGWWGAALSPIAVSGASVRFQENNSQML